MDTEHPSYTTWVRHPSGDYVTVLRVWNSNIDDYQVIQSWQCKTRREAKQTAIQWALKRHLETRLT